MNQNTKIPFQQNVFENIFFAQLRTFSRPIAIYENNLSPKRLMVTTVYDSAEFLHV